MSKTTRFVIRVSAGSALGMGHLVRCSHLARALHKRGTSAVFLVDQWLPQYQPWLADFAVIALYPDCEYMSQVQDANLCSSHLQVTDSVIVDDYRLSADWESEIAARVQRVIVIDDLANREHNCDFIIDYALSNNTHRYDALVPQQTQRLLGPDYCLVSEAYRNLSRAPYQPQEKFVIVVSLGGGGQLTELNPLLEGLIGLPAQDFEILVVAGALSTTSDSLSALEKLHSHVKVVRGLTSLQGVYLNAQLFIGAAGTSIYELNACELPAITFAISDNQRNAITDMEALGHYFQTTIKELQESDALQSLMKLIKQQYSRVRDLCDQRRVHIDGYGCERVAAILLGQSLNDIPKPDQSTVSQHTSQYQKWLQPGVIIEAIQDTDINAYVTARNLSENRDRMTVVNPISHIQHYCWWLSNQRESYILRQHGVAKLYIWHQLKTDTEQPYLIGGWFVASEDCSFELSALALAWQLEFCKKSHPDAIWLAIINKDNKYVNLLNSLHGFTAVAHNSLEQKAIENYFPMATPEQFNYLAFAPSRSGS